MIWAHVLECQILENRVLENHIGLDVYSTYFNLIIEVQSVLDLLWCFI